MGNYSINEAAEALGAAVSLMRPGPEREAFIPLLPEFIYYMFSAPRHLSAYIMAQEARAPLPHYKPEVASNICGCNY